MPLYLETVWMPMGGLRPAGSSAAATRFSSVRVIGSAPGEVTSDIDPPACQQDHFILFDLRLQERSPRPDLRRMGCRIRTVDPDSPAIVFAGASDTRPGCRMK